MDGQIAEYQGRPFYRYAEWFHEWRISRFDNLKSKEDWMKHGRQIMKNVGPACYIEISDEVVIALYARSCTEEVKNGNSVG